MHRGWSGGHFHPRIPQRGRLYSVGGSVVILGVLILKIYDLVVMKTM